MVIYEAARTKNIVDRLVALTNGLGLVITGASALLWGVLLMLLVFQIEPYLWWVGAIIGLAVGFGIGRLFTALLAAGLEGIAQLLVAQGEILSRLQSGAQADTLKHSNL